MEIEPSGGLLLCELLADVDSGCCDLTAVVGRDQLGPLALHHQTAARLENDDRHSDANKRQKGLHILLFELVRRNCEFRMKNWVPGLRFEVQGSREEARVALTSSFMIRTSNLEPRTSNGIYARTVPLASPATSSQAAPGKRCESSSTSCIAPRNQSQSLRVMVMTGRNLMTSV